MSRSMSATEKRKWRSYLRKKEERERILSSALDRRMYFGWKSRQKRLANEGIGSFRNAEPKLCKTSQRGGQG